MSAHEEKAATLFYEGRNCAQAVFAAFCDKTGIDEDTALRMSGAFGGGFGRLREVCGAACGMTMAAGCLYGYTSKDDPAEKKEHYALIQKLMNSYKDEMGSYICRDILKVINEPVSAQASPRTDEFYKSRPCVKCVRLAARILDEEIERRGE